MMNIVNRYLAHSLRRSKGRGWGWPKRAGTLESPCCGLETVAYTSATLGQDPQRELAARCLGGRTAPGQVRASSAQAWPGHPWLQPGEQEGERRREAGGQRSPCPEGLRPPLGERRAPRATSALPTEHPWGRAASSRGRGWAGGSTWGSPAGAFQAVGPSAHHPERSAGGEPEANHRGTGRREAGRAGRGGEPGAGRPWGPGRTAPGA